MFRRTRSLVLAIALLVGAALAARGSAAATGGELWVLAQDASQIKIVRDKQLVETISLPAGTSPHLVEFSPSGSYAYVAGLGNGDLIVVRQSDRAVAATLDLGATNTHQAAPSPDGSLVLVAQRASKSLIKIVADEAAERWTVAASLPLPAAPECSAFSADGRRAYVSLQTAGLLVVDLATMTIVKLLETSGTVACGFVPSRDGRTIYVTSNGTGGHLYRLDTTAETLQDLGYTFGAADLHVPALSPNEKHAYISDRGGEKLYIVDLEHHSLTSLALDPTPGANNDRPDGVVVEGNNVFVALRASGKLALIKARQERVAYLDLVGASTTALPHLAIRP